MVPNAFDPDAELLPENVYTASALAALENFVQESVRQEVEMRHWYKKKYGEEEHAVRSMVLTAYQSRFPHDECPDENSHDVSAFQCAASRLFSEIRPKPYYWLVDTELSKRKELMERLNIPNDYFESFFGQYEMSKKDRENHTQSLFADALARCETMWKRIFKTEMNVEKCWWMAKDE